MKKVFVFEIFTVILFSVCWAGTPGIENQVESTVVQQRMVDGKLEIFTETIPGAFSANIELAKTEPLNSYGIDEVDDLTGWLLWQTGDTYGMCNDCAISPEGSWLALGISLNNQRAECYQITSSVPDWQYGVGDVGTKVAISEGGEVFVFGYGPYVSIFNSSSGIPIWTYDCGVNSWVYQVAVRRDGSMIAIAFVESGTGHVMTFDPAGSIPLWDVTMPITTGFPFYGLRFCADGTRISANEKFYGWILDAPTGNILWEAPINNTESPIPMSADGSIMAIGLNAGGYCYVYQWDEITQTYNLLWQYVFTGGYSRWCNEVEVSADGGTVGAGSLEFITGGTYDGRVAVFDTWGDGTPLWVSDSFGDLVGEIAISDDGSVIAIGSWGEEDNSTPDLRIYDRNSSTPFFTINSPGSINSVDITPDGRNIFAGGKHVHNRIYGNGGDAYAIEVDLGTAAIEITPYNPPISIPAGGGSFDFNVKVTNFLTGQLDCDVWITATLPGGTQVGPLFGPVNLTIGGFIERDRTQLVPAGAPAGFYTYSALVGDYPDDIMDEDSFQFEKESGDGENGEDAEEWFNIGESLGDDTKNRLADDFDLLTCYPNPFNPTTVLSYKLPDASFVNLSIYDLSGREVAELVNGWREVGTHEVTWDASNLASGIYIYGLEIKGEIITGRGLLLK